ncbi:MAG: SprT family zinc-dependent metalloprotease [Verrucomicrobiota bacterium]
MNLFISKTSTPVIPKQTDEIRIGSQLLPICYKRNARARHYLIYVRRDGTLRVTIPKYGSQGQAYQFVCEKESWIRRQREKIHAADWKPGKWKPGTKVWFEGIQLPLTQSQHSGQLRLQVGPLEFPARHSQQDLRPIVEEQLRSYAKKVLPARTQELAEQQGLAPTAITVRNQSTRWGSCSEAGRISLNWRLIQVPRQVRDYVILHELMHMKELNHSRRFWNLVERVCPGYQKYDRWLKTNAVRLGM